MSNREELTTTLSVPAEHAELFRLAALKELGENAEWVQQQEAEARKLEGERELGADVGEQADYLLNRVSGPMRYLESSAAVVRASFAGETTFESRVVNLAHIAEAMAQKIVLSRLAETTAMTTSPLEMGDVPEVEQLTDALVWATRTSAQMHGLYEAECAKAEAA